MPRTEAANQAIRQAQQQKILEAAQRVFARKGEAATMADVSAEAKVSQGLPYRYFTSKEALLYQLLERATQAAPTALQQLLEMQGTSRDRLSWAITRMVESRREQPEIF